MRRGGFSAPDKPEAECGSLPIGLQQVSDVASVQLLRPDLRCKCKIGSWGNWCSAQLFCRSLRMQNGRTKFKRFGCGREPDFRSACQGTVSKHESGRSGLRFYAKPCSTNHQGQQCAVVSTDRCNTSFKFLRWRLVMQGLSRSLVKLASDGAEFGLAKARYINAFREVLSEKSVGIFVATALPR